MEDMGSRFVKWYAEAYWSARGEVFDIGGTPSRRFLVYLTGLRPPAQTSSISFMLSHEWICFRFG